MNIRVLGATESITASAIRESSSDGITTMFQFGRDKVPIFSVQDVVKQCNYFCVVEHGLIVMHYLVVFAQAHNDFRLPELQSIAELHGFDFALAPASNDPGRPYMVIDLAEEEHARILARRCILVKQVEYLIGGHVI